MTSLAGLGEVLWEVKVKELAFLERETGMIAREQKVVFQAGETGQTITPAGLAGRGTV